MKGTALAISVPTTTGSFLVVSLCLLATFSLLSCVSRVLASALLSLLLLWNALTTIILSKQVISNCFGVETH
jgi:hypothetical protein